MIKFRPHGTIVFDTQQRPVLSDEIPCSGLKMTLWDQQSIKDHKACGVVGIESIEERRGPKGREFLIKSEVFTKAYKGLIGAGVVGDNRINPFPQKFEGGPTNVDIEDWLTIRFHGRSAQ